MAETGRTLLSSVQSQANALTCLFAEVALLGGIVWAPSLKGVKILYGAVRS